MDVRSSHCSTMRRAGLKSCYRCADWKTFAVEHCDIGAGCEQSRRKSYSVNPPNDSPGASRRTVPPLAGDLSIFRTALEAVGEAVIITSPDLDPPGPCIEYVNPAFVQMTGYMPEDVVGRTPRMLQGPLTDRSVLDRMRAELMSHGTFAGEVTNYRKDGVPYIIEWRITPLRDGGGRISHWIAIQRDVTEARRAEEANAYLAAIVSSTSDAVLSFSLDGTIRSWNRGAEQIFGFTATEAIGQSSDLLVPDDHRHERQTYFEQASVGVPVQFDTVRRRKDGRLVNVAVTLAPIQKDGQVIGVSAIAHDIDERKRAEAHQNLLINELNHCVKNTLATVQSITSQTLRTASDPQQARCAIESRLIALSHAHDVLTRQDWEGAELEEIVLVALEPFISGMGDRLHLTGPRIQLPPRMALAIAMALHELATNAAKYGALSNATGEIYVGWKINTDSGSGTLRLRWEETGGPLVEAPLRRGFGSRLLERSLADELCGEVSISFGGAGVVCEVDAPLPEPHNHQPDGSGSEMA
jgi:PAS domain S-box-containing protein